MKKIVIGCGVLLLLLLLCAVGSALAIAFAGPRIIESLPSSFQTLGSNKLIGDIIKSVSGGAIGVDPNTGKFTIKDPTTGQQVAIDEKGNVQITGPNGETGQIKPDSKTWPTDMPNEISRLDGTIESTVSYSETSSKYWMVNYVNMDQTVFNDYVKAMEANGFENTLGIPDTSEGAMFIKGDLTIVLGYDKSEKKLTMTVTQEINSSSSSALYDGSSN